MSGSNKKMSVDELLLLEKQKATDKILFFVLLFTLVAIPLIVRAAIINFASPVITGTTMDSGMKVDVFTYYKFVWLGILVAILAIVFLYKMVMNGYTVASSYINGPLFIMFVFILCSGVFAEYKSLGLFGQFNRHDGTLTYLLYLILFFVAANITYSSEKTKKVLLWLSPVVIINFLFGILQFYGVNLLSSSFIRSILLPASIQEGAIKASSYFNSTLNNPNYTSGIAGVFTVIFLTKAVLSLNNKEKLLYGFIATLSFTLLLTSLSTSGFVTFVVLLPLILLFVFRNSSVKGATVTLTTVLLCFAAVFITLYSHNTNVWKESFGFFLGEPGAGVEQSQAHTVTIEEFASAHSPLQQNVAYAEDNKAEPLQDEFNLPAAAWGPGTGRVYIWEETIGLIKQKPFFGYGMDTLAYYFPQDDPAKNSNINSPDTIVDKPHNMYLGIAYGAGVFALLGFVWLVLSHAWAHIKLFRQRISSEHDIILTSLFVGWCAYLIQALFNDSIIGTAPIFWILFGVSVSLLRQREVAE